MRTQHKTKRTQFQQLREYTKKNLPAQTMSCIQTTPRHSSGHHRTEGYPPVSEIITENYEGHLIPFQAGDAFVNATAMCAAFGKRPVDFFSHTAYLALQEPLAEALNTRLVVAQNGGTLPGIWMHPELALVCAQWLSPNFNTWCRGIINRILLGELEVQSPFGTSQNYSVTLQQAVEMAQRLERFTLQKQVVCEVIKKASLKLAEEIRELESKAKKWDAWVNSDAHIPMYAACQLIEPGLGRQKCFDWLRAERILKPGAGGMPYSPYIAKGYFHTHRDIVSLGRGKCIEISSLFMTPAGVVFAKDLRKQYYQGVSTAAVKEAAATTALSAA